MSNSEKIILGCFGSHCREIGTFILKVFIFHVWNKSSLSHCKEGNFFIFIDYKMNWSELSWEKSPLWFPLQVLALGSPSTHVPMTQAVCYTEKELERDFNENTEQTILTGTRHAHNDQPSCPHNSYPLSPYLFSHVCSSPKHLGPSFSTSGSSHKHSLVSNPEMFSTPSHNVSRPH